jgi:2-dehydropantoate 2-reductase
VTWRTTEPHENMKDHITLGMYRFNDFTTEQNSPREAAILEDLGSILEAGGSTITIVPEIQRKKFSKNFWNVAFSSFTTLTRSVSESHEAEHS